MKPRWSRSHEVVPGSSNPFDIAYLAQQEIELLEDHDLQVEMAQDVVASLRTASSVLRDMDSYIVASRSLLPVPDDINKLILASSEVQVHGRFDTFACLDLAAFGQGVEIGFAINTTEMWPLHAPNARDYVQAPSYPLISGLYDVRY